MIQSNPFVIHGYEAPEYFCDRVEETATMTQMITQTGNVLLTAPRRIGKTGLIEHCYNQSCIKEQYHTFLIDLYTTKNLEEFVSQFGKSIIKAPQTTLDEIFSYLEQSDKPCIIAFDEFQTVANYPEKNVEALLRTHIQHCKNARFIFSGSQRHMLAEMFGSNSRPFYQSTVQLTLSPIDLARYVEFAQHHFEAAGKHILPSTIEMIYNRFEGITWYIQYVLNVLFSMTGVGETCEPQHVERAVSIILGQLDYSMNSLVYQLPSKQKELLQALCREGKTQSITSKKFLNKYKLTASMVQAAIKGLLEKDFVSCELGTYFVYDKFLAEWLLKRL